MKVYAGFISEQLNEIANSPELKDKPITLFYDYPVRDITQLQENPYNILFIQEPNQLFGFHDWAVQNHHHFDVVCTWSDPILSCSSHSYLFPFGAGNVSFIDPSCPYHNGKKFEVSFLCGNKKLIEGHFLRHNIFEAQEKITIPKHFIYTAPWDGGKDRCWESMYHIAIENSRNKNFFTEKIVDAFLTKTIPIYWGCPNIDEFFNTDGIITFNNVDELTVILNNLTYEFYESKKDIIEENYNKAKQYADFVKRIKEFLEEICKLNNI
jgi:hypothetical protein